VCLAAPFLTRALLLGEKGLAPRLADFRGVLADASVALCVAGLLGVLLLARRWWGKALGWLVLVAFLLATFGIYEFVSMFDSLYALTHARYLADPTFIGGSVLHMRHPILLGALIALGTLGVVAAHAPGAVWWRGWAIVLGVCVLGHAVLPMSHAYDGWRQRHAIHAQASIMPASAKLGSAGTVGAEVREVFRTDLGGRRWIGPLEGKPNVLLIMVEAASGPLLPSVAKAAKVETSASMPKLGALAKKHLLFSHVVSHQRQTNRGEYGILCGDYPKLLSDESKMTEQVYGESRRCLPALLRDHGYETVYIQAAPLGFMLKDQFMKKAGFETLIGDEAFEKSYARTDWGVDDKAFFEQAIEYVTDLHAADEPFFATMLTVGTHHPFTFPQGKGVESGKERRARAFRYADDALAAFIDALQARGVLRDTVVIITSDESAGMVDTPISSVRLLSQSWSFAVVMFPEPEPKQVDTLYAHVDTALSVADLLGLEREAEGFAGRSWFREYESPRPVFGANTYAHKVIMWTPTGKVIICDEAFEGCKRYATRKTELVPKMRGKPALPRERRLLAEVARATRSGQGTSRPPKVMGLLTASEVVVPAADGKKLLTGGQYLRIPAGTRLRVDFDLEVIGEDAELELQQDLFFNGHERFARDDQRVRSGERWQLSYQVDVPRESGQLVVQLYATTVAGQSATLRVHQAQLSMSRARTSGLRVEVVADEISTAARRP
jgi:arylsulfatase A-like enzyme